ncbi:hypothetical protein N7454_004479 [Penicillium verhagenii]|nr:hypothetical protein N7454_004479 [Penicillium verhagenii]
MLLAINLDFDLANFTVSTKSADGLLKRNHKKGYKVIRLLETHSHTDDLSAAYHIQATILAKGQPHAPICIGENITTVQSLYAHEHNISREELDNSFDQLFRPDETFRVGELTAVAIVVFNPDVGRAPCDFPGADARILWRSMQRLLSFPDTTRLYAGCGPLFPPNNEVFASEPVLYVTVAEQRATDKHLETGSMEEDFVEWRSQRDQGLSEPEEIHQSGYICRFMFVEGRNGYYGKKQQGV